ncbi:unnamed protein product [Rangifer tarandus platyrhynchus]|uniref:Uncharacterized protein n=1 Tax=Rangifer tarandus platyrhynchus TaxID=3082113 RepID=A0AC59ZNY8_RANTA
MDMSLSLYWMPRYVNQIPSSESRLPIILRDFDCDHSDIRPPVQEGHASAEATSCGQPRPAEMGHDAFPTSLSNEGREGKSLSRVQLFVTPWTIWSMGFSRPEHWSGEPFPSPGDLPNPGIEAGSPTLQAGSFPAEPPGKHPSQQSAFRKSVPLRAPMRLAAASLLLIPSQFLPLQPLCSCRFCS